MLIAHVAVERLLCIPLHAGIYGGVNPKSRRIKINAFFLTDFEQVFFQLRAEIGSVSFIVVFYFILGDVDRF